MQIIYTKLEYLINILLRKQIIIDKKSTIQKQ